MFIAVLGVITLVISLILPRGKKALLGYLSAIASRMYISLSVFTTIAEEGINFYNGLYISDSISTYFKQIFIISAALVTLMSASYVKKLSDSRGEFFTLIVFATLGMMVMASPNDFITLYIGIELMSYQLYYTYSL